jgi:hypothetical protein
LAFGQKGITVAGSEVWVYSWDTNVRWPIDPDPGQQFSEIDVRVCSGPGSQSGPVSTVALDFVLEMKESRQFTSENVSYNSDELIGNQTTIGPGDCVRGLVIFQTPKGLKPVRVIFSSSSTLKWDVP